jgi:DNA-binding transcriptional LysR family regulator
MFDTLQVSLKRRVADMELRHLRYFVAVAEEEHMSRAARRLNMQQPPLSKQIQLLEQELGVTLFLRQPRKITLNAAGKVFLSDARRILALAHESIERVRQFNLGEEGSVRVGFTSSASMHPLTLLILERFRRAFPLVSLQIEEGANHDLLYLVEQERLDVAFVRSQTERYPGLVSRTLMQESMSVALPSDEETNSLEQVDLETLSGLRMVLYRQANGSGIGELLINAMAKRGLALNVVEETQRILGALNLVAAGFGVTVVPSSINVLRLPNLRYVPLVGPGSFTVPLNMAYRKNILAESIRRFLMTSEEVCG